MELRIQQYTQHYKSLLSLGIPIVIGQVGVIILAFADTLMIGHHSTPELAAASFVNNVFTLCIIFSTGFSYGLTPLVGSLYGNHRLMIGHHSTPELAAASFVNNVFTLCIIFSTGFSYGLTPLVGSLYGNHRYAEAGQALRCSLVANTLVALLLLRCSLVANTLVALLLTLIMAVVYFKLDSLGQPEELLPLIRPYYLVLLASLLFVMLFNGFKQFTDGITDTKTAMWILLVGNALNIVGNYVLINGKLGFPEMGLLGAGISTLFSRIMMVAVFAWYCDVDSIGWKCLKHRGKLCVD